MPQIKAQKGFTIIELLLAIVIIGVLAGVIISVINPRAQKNRAEDSVKLTNMEKLVQGIEAFQAVEGRYPADTNGNGNPRDDSNGLTTYLAVWPNNEPPGSTYSYWTNANGTSFGLVVTLSNTTRHLKYHTGFVPPKVRECTNSVPSSTTC